MATILNTGMTAPTTGRAFAATRMALGVSQHALAQAMHINDATLLRWEASDEHISEEWRDRWQAALRSCAAVRWRAYQRLGIRTADLPAMPIGQLLRLYTA